MLDTMYLRRKQKIIIPKGNSKLDPSFIVSILEKLEQLGYTFSDELIQRFYTLDINTATIFCKLLRTSLKDIIGSKVYLPMYPNFPKQVLDADAIELYCNAMEHYLGALFGIRILPEYEKKERPYLIEKTRLKVITIGSLEDLYDICRKMLQATTSWSPQDIEDIECIVENIDNINNILPESMPHKENMCHFLKMALYHRAKKDNKSKILNIINVLWFNDPSLVAIKSLFRTTTDILRFVTALSDGDVSLAENTTYNNFNRAERKLFIELIESCKNIEEDMFRHKIKWIRLGEILHPGDYKNKFPKCFNAFNTLRNGKYRTFNSSIEQDLISKNVDPIITKLIQKPGLFARRLDHILRHLNETHRIIAAFESKQVTSKIATPVLLQVISHFKHRNDPDRHIIDRVVFPKGRIAKLKAIKPIKEDIPVDIVNQVINICENELIERFHKLPPLNKVYISPLLKNYIVPFSQRSASKTLRTIVRGSKVPFCIDEDTDKNTIRLFLWWKDGRDRTDIDLSAGFYDSDWCKITWISYTKLRSYDINAVHSGDITSAPNGASEFIDVDITSALKYDIRYVVMYLFSFTEQLFCDLPECFAGWMMRDKPESGEIFEPKTVVNKFDLTANNKIALPLIMDLQEKQIIWCDLSYYNKGFYNNIESNNSALSQLCTSIINCKKTTLYDLFNLHAKARGSIVDSIDDANTIFNHTPLNTNDEIKMITPFDIEDIMCEFMK